MSWNLIEKPAVKAKSQVHLTVAMPTKRGQPKVYIAVPTVICGKYGFEKCETADVMLGEGENAGKLWVKPHADGQRKAKQRLHVVQVQIEPIKGMTLKSNAEYIDYEPGPDNVGIVVTLPDWFFGVESQSKPSEPKAVTSNRSAHEKPGSLEIDGNVLVLGGKECTFTPSQAVIVKLLVERFGKTVTRAAIHNALYQLDPNCGADIKIIDIQMHKIRQRIEEAKFPVFIMTHHGQGFEMRNPVA